MLQEVPNKTNWCIGILIGMTLYQYSRYCQTNLPIMLWQKQKRTHSSPLKKLASDIIWLAKIEMCNRKLALSVIVCLENKPLDLLPPCSFMCCLTHNFSESLILIVSLRKINSSNIRSHFPKLTPSIKKVQVAQTLNRVILRKVLVYRAGIYYRVYIYNWKVKLLVFVW